MNQAFDIVVIGASLGGYRALQNIISALPETYPVPLCIVQHIGRHESALPELLQTVTGLTVRYATDREPLAPGRIYIAPPDRHLVIGDNRLRLSNGAKENYTRPAIDPLFRTAAVAYRERAIGLVLTGELDDGTVGLQAIKACGGIAMVQDPQEAEAASMPRSALEHVEVDYCLPLDGIPQTLIKLANGSPRAPAAHVPESVFFESRMNLSQESSMEELDKIGKPSRLTCPECNGVLWEVNAPEMLRFRCHTGHAFSAGALDLAQNEQLEEAIWFAIRALHEKRRLLDRLAQSAREGEREHAAREYEKSAALSLQHAARLQELVSVRQGETATGSTEVDQP
ncbi:MAG TPA: chemotaxis protein CheB [Methylophilaceae bacterium]|nr:chemotaxis protein CheB [Methylophilaceae bacterium]